MQKETEGLGIPGERRNRKTLEQRLNPRITHIFEDGGGGGSNRKKKEDIEVLASRGKEESEKLKLIGQYRKESVHTEAVKTAKGKVDMAAIKKVPWLDKSLRGVKHCSELIYTAGYIAKGKPDDISWLTEQTARLVYRTGSLTPEARVEVGKFVQSMRGRIEELSRSQNATTAVERFDYITTGRPTQKVVPIEEQLYDSTHTGEESIIEPALVESLREIEFDIAATPSKKQDIRWLQGRRQQLLDIAKEQGASIGQTQEAAERIEELILREQERKEPTGEFSMPETRWLDTSKLPARTYKSPDFPDIDLDRSPLYELVERINREGMNARESVLNGLYLELQALPRKHTREILDKKGRVIGTVQQITDADIDTISKRIRETFVSISNARREYDAVYMEEMLSPQGREARFYKVMRPLTGNNELNSRELLDLPFTTQWDTFIYALNEINFDREGIRLPPGMTTDRARRELIAHYTNLRETMVALHDIDYQARNAAGDIKGFKGAMTYFQNHFFVEAIKDPIVQEMARCYEEALKQIRDNNDGWIPPSETTFNSERGFCEWDERARAIFMERVKSGQVYDVARDELGKPRLDRSGIRFERGSRFTIPTQKEQRDQVMDRINAAMRMGKGTGIVSMRLLEIFAFSRVPGYNSRPGGAVFSSISYEGIARWLNPMDVLFNKFKMGDQRYPAFFSALVGIEEQDIVSWLKFNPGQFKKIQEMAVAGQLEDWLRKRYPKNAEDHVRRLRDAQDLFAFSGLTGPLSQWRTVDMTLRMSDLEKERIGASMRLQRAEPYAAAVLAGKYKDHPIEKALREKYPNWDTLPDAQKIEARRQIIIDTPAFAKPMRDLDYFRMQRNLKDREPYDEEAMELALAYKAFVYAQMAERSPVIAAHGIIDHYHRENPEIKGNTSAPKLLRTVIVEDILREDATTHALLSAIYAEQHRGAMPTDPSALELNMVRDVIATSSPSVGQLELQDRINALEDDVMLLQRATLESGPDGMPRAITREDLDVITGRRTLFRNNRKIGVINETTRRDQAWQYVQTVRDRVLGQGMTSQQWHERLGASYNADGALVIEHPDALEGLIHEAGGHQALLDGELLTRRDSAHMGTEDVQWNYLDIDTLGERQEARRGNDLENRVNTIIAMTEYFDMLSAHPDMDALAKQLGKIKISESQHDPKEAHKFVWLLTYATGQLYRQGKLAYLPFIGKWLQKAMPLSAMQCIEGFDDAVAWSANNMHQFIHKVRDKTGLPAKHINANGELEPWNIHSLEHNLAATKGIAFLEALIIGGVIGVAASGIGSIAEGTKPEKEKH